MFSHVKYHNRMCWLLCVCMSYFLLKTKQIFNLFFYANVFCKCWDKTMWPPTSNIIIGPKTLLWFKPQPGSLSHIWCSNSRGTAVVHMLSMWRYDQSIICLTADWPQPNRSSLYACISTGDVMQTAEVQIAADLQQLSKNYPTILMCGVFSRT